MSSVNVLPLENRDSDYLDEKLQAEKEYWLQQLSGEMPVIGLPLDRPRPATWSGQKDVVYFEIEQEIVNQLRKICDDNDTLTFTVVLTALKICLHLYTGIEDVCVGTSIHERYKEVASLNKVLALRDRVTSEMTAGQALAAIKRTLSEAYAHQKYSIEKILQLLNIETPVNRCPLFNVVALFDRINNQENAGHLKNDLTLLFSPRDNNLACTIEYRPALFDRAGIEIFASHYREVLRTLLYQPDLQIGRFELITAKRKEAVVYNFNRTEKKYPRGVAIHQLFEEQVRRTPAAIAVVYGKERLTFQELNGRANQLARYLHRLGFEPGMRAGIYLTHTPAMLVAVLGILKAGGAYVPFDPSHPVTGLAGMLADARVPLLLTESKSADKLPYCETRNLFLDAEEFAVSQEENGDLPRSVRGEDLAYIIYTSGSTGEPKGVMIQHASLVNYITWASEIYLKGRPLDFALYSSLAFDLTVTSIYTPLLNGNCIYIYQQSERATVLPEILNDNEIGVLKLTPSHLSLIKERDNSQSRIRTLIVGGEALETDLAYRIYESFGRQVEIFNEYGPTEATVGCMLYKYDPQRDHRGFVPIGRPAANTQIYVLDKHLSPVPENIIGDLYISGDGLALGYLNKEELTKEKFVDNPFIDGKRMYKSGDLARWLPEDVLEFVGRNDEQVKFHGYRVELNHIKITLNIHPQIRDSVVMVVKDRGGNDVMIAYYASRQELDAGELRRFLSEYIVEETIPNIFVHLRRMPLTLNGKVNHRALPTLEQVREKLKRTFVAPQTRIEQQLAGIWARVLGMERIGIHDNFFELGGHSLLATQLISRIKDGLQVDLPLRSLFEAPTIAGLVETIEQLQLTGASTRMPALVPVSRDRELPLSFAQQRLWFLDRLQPGNHFYNISAGLRLSGPLNIDVLERTLSELTRRHEVLRTNFPTVNGIPVQRINPPGRFHIPVLDLRSYEEEEMRAEILRVIEEQARRPFDLANDLLLRVIRLQLADDEQIIFFMLHHIVGDAWSMNILIDEVSKLYRAFLDDQLSPLDELPIQYVDYAVWQREWLSGEVLEKEIAYWRDELADVPPVLELPADHPRPPVQKFEGASESYEIDERIADGLKELSRREGVTLFMTMLAAFKTLLYRYTNQTDILVGTPIAGRNLLETESLIGFFTNTLALRTRLRSESDFLTLLRQVRDVTLRAYTHQDLPFEKLVEELNPERSLSHTPLLQVVFGFYSSEEQALDLPGLKLRPVGYKGKTAKFDLVHNVVESSGKITGNILYNTDLFEQNTISRLIRHYAILLESIVNDPQQCLRHIPILTADEKRQLLSVWNDTGKEYPLQQCVHHLFEQRAEEVPDKAAVVSEEAEITYGDLNRRANRLAHFLRAKGVGPEIPVCILLDRSIEMVVGILAVLKAGGAYVPLDPATPLQRLAYFLDDSQAPLLITHERLAETLPAYWAQVVFLDFDPEQFDEYSADNPANKVVPSNLAYAVYTSGSTGQPKGVQIQHEALLNLIHWHNSTYGVSSTDRATQLASPAFDASVWELWPYLTTGASVYIPPEEIRLNVSGLIEWLSEKAITISFLPTPLAEIVIEKNWPSGTSLRALLTGGDKLHRGLQRALPFELINHYGPSENTVVATSANVSPAVRTESTPPIGKPIDNTEVYVLDAQLQPAPIGVAGEIYIGGSGLARGYLGRPELTAERFSPHPFSQAPGARLYRTGDLARRLPNGELEFLGRLDNQVKLRGFRIELGEIEAALAEHPAVAQSVVVLRHDPPLDGRLVAYVVLAPEAECISTSLRDFLKLRLPDYMTPASFLFLPALPLTTNGKLDREALPVPTIRSEAEAASAEERSMTRLERLLAKLWCEVLGLTGIGLRDNFFEVGGDSIKAAIIINRLQQQLQRIIHVVTIFDAPNVEQFAAYLEERYQLAVAAWEKGQSAAEENSVESAGIPAVVSAAALNGCHKAGSRIKVEEVAELRQMVEERRWRRTPQRSERKNPPALFVLSSPRSGSTLLRVMLGGHSRLFAPPELELLGFDDLRQRGGALSGKHSFWRQGTIRALMQIRGCEKTEAEREIEGYEEAGMRTQQFYRLLQEAIGHRTLVDKTPSYSMDIHTLQQAEAEFEGARYLHLVRNPYAMIHSYEEAHLDQIFPRFEHRFSCRAVAELVWLISEQNILEFLSQVPEERQHRVRFEQLVSEPERVMRQVSRWLGLEYEEEMIEPYKEKQRRMTDGVHEVGKMLGDIKFHGHRGIEAEMAERWRDSYDEKFLSEQTWEVAERLGYERWCWDICITQGDGARYKNMVVETPEQAAILSPILPIGRNGEADEVSAHIDRLSDEEVETMLAGLMSGNPTV